MSSSSASTSSHQAARPPHQPLPAIGTSYSTLNAFKLDVYQRSLANECALAIRVSATNSYVHFNCSLWKNEDQSTWCTCLVKCSIEQSSGQYKVFEVNEEHSCGVQLREEHRVMAVKKTRERMEKLKLDEEKKKVLLEFERLGVLEVPDERSQESVEDRPRRDTSGRDYTGSKSKLDQGSLFPTTPRAPPPPSNRLVHPSIYQIADKVEKLTKGPPLVLPTATSSPSFATHTDLRVHASAAAVQQGFSLYLGTSNEVTKAEVDNGLAFALHCAHSHSRWEKREGGRCGVFFKAAKSEGDGKWRVVKSVVKHSHEMDAREDLQGCVGLRKRRAAVDEDDDEDEDEDGGAGSGEGSTSKGKTLNAVAPAIKRVKHVHPPPPTPSPALPPAPPSRFSYPFISTAPSIKQRPPPSSTSHPFLPSLTTFLNALSPTLALLAPLLLNRGGLRSIESLVALLGTSEEGWKMLFDGVGVEKVLGEVLRGKLRELRASAGTAKTKGR